MLPFTYHRPKGLGEVFALTAVLGTDYRLLAGGTDLTVGLRHGSIRVGHVIDVKRVPELSGAITVGKDEVVVPATVTMTTLLADPFIAKTFPALIEAASTVGSHQIRNRATLAGNICNASPAADTVPVLALHDASVRIAGPNGVRSLLVADFIQGNRKIDLAAGEVVVAVTLPLPREPVGTAFDRITRRRGVDLATVNLCCAVRAEGRLRFAIGAASPRPLVVDDTDGRVLAARDEAERQEVIAELLSVAKPITDVRASADYRMGMLAVLAERTRARALGQLGAGDKNV